MGISNHLLETDFRIEYFDFFLQILVLDLCGWGQFAQIVETHANNYNSASMTFFIIIFLKQKIEKFRLHFVYNSPQLERRKPKLAKCLLLVFEAGILLAITFPKGKKDYLHNE